MQTAWEFYIPNTPLKIAILDEGCEPHADISESRWHSFRSFLNYPYSDEGIPDTCKFCGHGMAIAGIIVASTNNDSLGVASMAGRDSIEIVSETISTSTYSGGDFFATSFGIRAAFFEAVDSGVAIINTAFGHYPPFPYGEYYDFPTIREGIQAAQAAGVLVVCAAGNNCGYLPGACDLLSFPASEPYTFSAGALTSYDAVLDLSQGGDLLDVMAYGTAIYTTDRMDTLGDDEPDCKNLEDYRCAFGNTSAATGQVTGLAALILQRCPDLIGEVDSLKKIIRYSCEIPNSQVEDTARINNRLGWGRISTLRALLAVTRGDAGNDGTVNVGDVVYIDNYIFKNGPEPRPHILTGDANCDGACNVGDIIYLVNYLFMYGPEPRICFEY